MRIRKITSAAVASAIAAALVLGGASVAFADPVDPPNNDTEVSQTTDPAPVAEEEVEETPVEQVAEEPAASEPVPIPDSAPASQPVAERVEVTTETPAPPADTVAPKAVIKPESRVSNGVYSSVSVKLSDNVGVVGYTINDAHRSVTPNKFSDANGIAVGKNGGVEGKNVLVVKDAAGNTGTLEFTLDATGPKVTVKPGALGTESGYREVSFKLFDPALVDKVTLNGVVKDLTNNRWSDLNGVKPGVFGAVEGENTLVAFDALGNTTTFTFVLDTIGPKVTVKGDTMNEYEVVSFKLEDLGTGVDKVTLNGVVKDLTDNKWSDLNGVKPGVFGAVEGENTLVAFDVAGNTTTVVFTLKPADTVAPTATDTTQVYEAKQDGRIAVTVTFSEPVKSPGQGWYAVGGSNGTKWTKVYYSSKEYTIEFTDLAGNEGTHTFTVDATAPTVVGEPKQEYDPKNGQNRTKVTLTFSEPVNPASLPQGWYGSGVTFSKVYFGEKKNETVNFTDIVGNPGSTTFDVKDLKPAPEKPKPIAWGWSWNGHFGGGWLNNLLNSFGGWRW